MSDDETYLRRPSATDDELWSRFAPTFEFIAEGNVERERARGFPHEQVRWLKDAGFGTLRIPREDGGFGASLQQTFALLADLGAADPNVAHIFRNHLAFVEDRLNAPRSATNDTWIKRFLSGAFVGGGWTEANNVTLAKIASTVTRRDDHWVVTRRQILCDGQPLRRLARRARAGMTTATCEPRWCARTIPESNSSMTGGVSASAPRPADRPAMSRSGPTTVTCSPPQTGSVTRHTSIRPRCCRCSPASPGRRSATVRRC